MKNPVREATRFVLGHAREVSLDRENIERIAHEWTRKRIQPPRWENMFHLARATEEQLLTYLLVLDSLNFCFWADRSHLKNPLQEKWRYTHKGKEHSGYFGLALALRVWFENNPEKANFAHLSQISRQEFWGIFQGGTGLLFMKKRWEIVRAVSRVFMKKYGGDPALFVKLAGGVFSVLVPKIARELPSFNDVVVYKGKKILLLKRAQILAGDISGAFRGRGIGAFRDLDYLTAFPDYKLPQILQYWGALRYSPALQKKIKHKILIPAGSEVEVEIRAATVQAVELLRRELARRGVSLTSLEVDWILWNESKRIEFPMPHHLTKTVFY